MTAFAITTTRRKGASATIDRRPKLMAGIVFATLSFNFVLCFVNTNVLRVGSNGVILAELALIGAALVVVLSRSREIVVVLGLWFAYCVFLSALHGAFDPKPVRDMMIPIIFYVAAREAGTPEMGDRLVMAAVAAVLAVGLFEYFLLPVYIKYFDILGYYVSRGTVQAADAEGSSDRLFVSGMRYEGRTLLPFLGEHRVSSIFLEPVSVGNFGAICFSWIALRHWRRPLSMILRLLPVVAIFVFADARFGLFVSLAGLVVIALARFIGWVPVLLAPFAMTLVLACVGFSYPDTAWDNTLPGRLLLSGQMLSQLTPAELFAFVGVDRFTSDSGYTYTFTQIGLVGFAALWTLFVIAPCRDLQAWRFRLFVALYIVLLLTISNSIYSIKTGALMFYLLGTLGAARTKPPLDHANFGSGRTKVLRRYPMPKLGAEFQR
jgi:putative polymerase